MSDGVASHQGVVVRRSRREIVRRGISRARFTNHNEHIHRTSGLVWLNEHPPQEVEQPHLRHRCKRNSEGGDYCNTPNPSRLAAQGSECLFQDVSTSPFGWSGSELQPVEVVRSQ